MGPCFISSSRLLRGTGNVQTELLINVPRREPAGLVIPNRGKGKLSGDFSVHSLLAALRALDSQLRIGPVL